MFKLTDILQSVALFSVVLMNGIKGLRVLGNPQFLAALGLSGSVGVGGFAIGMQYGKGIRETNDDRIGDPLGETINGEGLETTGEPSEQDLPGLVSQLYEWLVNIMNKIDKVIESLKERCKTDAHIRAFCEKGGIDGPGRLKESHNGQVSLLDVQSCY